MNTHNHEALTKLTATGLDFNEIIADGRFHRGRDHSSSHWYIANEGITSTGKSWLFVSAGDFRETGGEHKATAVYHSWDSGEFTADERREIRTGQRAAKASNKARLTEDQKAAALKAMHIWRDSKPGSHPYLKAKGLDRLNTRVSGDALLIPVFAVTGEFCSLQKILPDGRKGFMPGGRAAGCYHPINWYFGTEPKLYIAEGWATAAAIATVMRVPVVAAFSAGNLLLVAKQVRNAKPGLDIVVAADNDLWTEGNPGLVQATRAARAVGGRVIAPKFDDRTGKPTDWWDLFRQQGRI